MALKFEHILVPIDFTDRCAAAAKDADALALGSNGKLTFLHVFQGTLAAVGDHLPVEAAATDIAEALAHRRVTARKWVESLELTSPTDHIAVEVVEGAPADEVVEHSKKADLIVIASHGRRGLSRWLLGSVAERVIRGAHCSTLVVRERDGED